MLGMLLWNIWGMFFLWRWFMHFFSRTRWSPFPHHTTFSAHLQWHTLRICYAAIISVRVTRIRPTLATISTTAGGCASTMGK